MTGQRRLDPPKGSNDHIEEAEFYDVDDAGQSATAGVIPPKSKSRRGCIAAIVVPLLCIFGLFVTGLYSADPPPRDDQLMNTNLLEVVDAEDTAGSDRAAQADVTTLLHANDPRVCDHPDTVAFIRSRVLQDKGHDDARLASILELARVDLTEVTASGVQPDIHEITCDANLRYGDGNNDFRPITFKVRAATDPAQPPVYYFDMPFWDYAALVDAITDRPRKIVNAESAQQAQPTRQTEPSSDGNPAEGTGAAVTPSDEDQFAPH